MNIASKHINLHHRRRNNLKHLGDTMPSEKKKTSMLRSSDYKINGNLLRAFYDKHGKLVFVLDSTINDIKPNVLLVITSRGDRKWDDILSNDYDMDLELVRPKKDNKYQKLDIEYDGLVVYDNLIRAYDEGGNVKKALKDLENFRAVSVRRSATERLAASKVIAENARETIERTGDTIVELKAKIKVVRAKLLSLRRSVGKIPTKQSAAKILRAEAQLDVLTGKLERATKRLENANKRLLIAEDDMEAARKVLDLVPEVDGQDFEFKTVETKAAKSVKKELPQPEESDDDEEESGDEESDEDFWLSDDDEDDSEQENYEDDTSDDVNKDNDIKPLFDKDPKIIDENIAFKPISFDENISSDVADDKEVEQEKTVVSSLEPPKAMMDMVSVPDSYTDDEEIKFDDVFSVNEPKSVDYTAEEVSESESNKNALDIEENVDVPEFNNGEDEKTEPVLEQDNCNAEIVAPVEEDESDTINVTSVSEQSAPVAAVAPAPTVSENLVRPVPPIVQPVVNKEAGSGNKNHKPNFLYYVLLLVLIALSVFTLWLYQRSNVPTDAVPVLATDDKPVVVQDENVADTDVKGDVVAPEKVEVFDNPFVAEGNEAPKEEESNSLMEKVASDSLGGLAKIADINADTESEEESGDSNDVAEEDGAEQLVEDSQETEEEVQEPVNVNKPEYKVTQDNVFINDNAAPQVSGGNLCDGDVAPDANGCCPGETYSTVNNQKVCCPDDGGDCFPPIF